jgi:hypothetical protein
VLPLVIERLSHPRESVRKKAVMALLHFHQMDPDRSGPLSGVLFLCYKSVNVLLLLRWSSWLRQVLRKKAVRALLHFHQMDGIAKTCYRPHAGLSHVRYVYHYTISKVTCVSLLHLQVWSWSGTSVPHCVTRSLA